jgi:hypothetical protein
LRRTRPAGHDPITITGAVRQAPAPKHAKASSAMPSQVAPAHHRHRSSSDPFHDANAINTRDAYPRSTAPSNQPRSSRKQPYPPDPSTTYPLSAPAHREKMADVAPRLVDNSPRARMHRSQTSVPYVAVLEPVPCRHPGARADRFSSCSTTGTTAPRTVTHTSRRSLSQDSVVRQAAAMEKAKATNKSRPGKKGSVHADVIDRMDFSGVGAGLYMLIPARFPSLLMSRSPRSLPPRLALRCLRPLAQPASHQGPDARLDGRHQP